MPPETPFASGERHDPETHLIQNVLSATAGDIPHVAVHGGDYQTPGRDGPARD